MGEQLLDGPVTILFSDVEGSTDVRTERGDAVAHRILRAHEEVVRNCPEFTFVEVRPAEDFDPKVGAP